MNLHQLSLLFLYLDNDDVPVKFKSAVVDKEVPKLTSVEPIVTESFAKCRISNTTCSYSYFICRAPVVIPEPPTISKADPKSISCVSATSPCITILSLVSLSFAIEPLIEHL